MAPRRRGVVETVVKVGGGLLRVPGAVDRLATALGALDPVPSIVVVPGGGPFTDAVREASARAALPDDAAHWMAILGMDQYAYLLAARVRGARLVWRAAHVRAALAARCIPVLAPYGWLRRVDPLPHSWDVTSDSIAAWLAGELGARRLVLVKPAAMALADAVDGHFACALPAGVQVWVVGAPDVERLGSVLRRQ
jgi:aspartokinase-like uncharacterized kinase